MKRSDLEEKIYYDDSFTKVTASFIAGYKKIILPIPRVTDIIVTHKSYSMYVCFLVCLLLLLMLVSAPFLPSIIGLDIPMDYIFYFFIPVFGTCCIWFRFIYENYVELYIVLDDKKKYLLRVITLGKRTIIYDIADAIRSALSDYRARTEEEAARDTDSLKLRRLRSMMMQSEVDMTPELRKLVETKPKTRKISSRPA